MFCELIFFTIGSYIKVYNVKSLWFKYHKVDFIQINYY